MFNDKGLLKTKRERLDIIFEDKSTAVRNRDNVLADEVAIMINDHERNKV